MSDYETHKGKLILFQREENETDLNYVKRLQEKLGQPFEEQHWEDDIKEYISWTDVNKGAFYFNDKFYLNTEHKELDSYDDICELEGNDVDGYTYFMRWYNGGAGFSELIDEGFENLNKK